MTARGAGPGSAPVVVLTCVGADTSASEALVADLRLLGWDVRRWFSAPADPDPGRAGSPRLDVLRVAVPGESPSPTWRCEDRGGGHGS